MRRHPRKMNKRTGAKKNVKTVFFGMRSQPNTMRDLMRESLREKKISEKGS